MIKRKRNFVKAAVTVFLIVTVRTIYQIATVKDKHANQTGKQHSYLSAKIFKSPLQHVSTFGSEDIVIPDKLAKNLCENITRPKNTTYSTTGPFWHIQKHGTVEIMVYSAIYDDRPAVGSTAVIRMSVVSNLPKKSPVYCYLWYSGLQNPYFTTVDVVSTGRGERLFGVQYQQLLYTCSLPSSQLIPTHVSLVTSLCQHSNVFIPIDIPARRPWQHEFGICVAIAFGEVETAVISEWIELHRVFGVTEFNIYNASMSLKMKDVFDEYESRGLLRIHQMPPPVPDFSKKGSKLGSPASLNDCMLRNMYRYRYVVVLDFDEFIVPRTASNYSTMLQEIDKQQKLKEPWFSYTFRNTYYFKDIQGDLSQPQYLTTMTFRKRNAPNGYLFAPKSFISPLHCLSVFNHYCWIRFPTVPKKFTIDVSPNIAMSHHYRWCGFKTSECETYFSKAFQDDYLLKYKPLLEDRVKDVLEHIAS